MSSPHLDHQLFDRPIVILGASRSGTTLMFRNLAEHPNTWSLYEESYPFIYEHYPLDPERGDRVDETPSRETAQAIVGSLYRAVHNKEIFVDHPLLKMIPRKVLQRQLNRLYKRPPLRFVEKTPANILRVPLLAQLFPDGRFIYLVRKPEDTISSLMEGWKRWSGMLDRKWTYTKWHYVAPPGWQEWIDRSLQEICAFQWIECNRIAWADLKECCGDTFLMIRHEDALADPEGTYVKIRQFVELDPSPFFESLVAHTKQRVFTYGGTKPRPDKWKSVHRDEIESVRHMFQPLRDQLYPEDVT